MLIRDNYKVSVMRSVPQRQTHNAGKQSPKLSRLGQLLGEREVTVGHSGARPQPATGWERQATVVSEKHKTLSETGGLIFLICKMGKIYNCLAEV